MLIEFAITNFRSIKERQVFSMLPSDRVKERHLPLQSVGEEYPDLKLLPLAILYGKNNVGKSNLVKAFRALQWLVLNSHKFSLGDLLLANESFAFDIQTQEKPTIFELDFIATDRTRYLFIVEFNKTNILREELHQYVTNTKKTNTRKLYIRKEGEPIQFTDELKGPKKSIEERLTEKKLFLSKAVDENNVQLRPIYDFFQKYLHITDMSGGYIEFQTRYFGQLTFGHDGHKKMEALNDALRNIDAGILFLEVSKEGEIPKNIKVENSEGQLSEKEKIEVEKILDVLKHKIKAVHRLFDGKEEKGTTTIGLENESEGTRKFIALFTKFMELGTTGGVFIVDELERSFHPLLTQVLIKIMADPKTNPKQAQLIFTTHDSSLLNLLDNALSTDQINILEKDSFGATEIFTVSDIRGLRGDIPWQKWYMSGKLEGIPNISAYQINQTLQAIYGKA